MATQTELGNYLDIDARHVRRLIKSGVLPPSKSGGYDFDACRLAYIRYLRGICSGQVKEQRDDDQSALGPTEDGGDYTALLEKERYRRIKRENDLEENLVAPVSLLTEALIKAGRIIIAHLETLPLRMKTANPSLTGDDIQLVRKTIALCRNEIADMHVEVDDGSP